MGRILYDLRSTWNSVNRYERRTVCFLRVKRSLMFWLIQPKGFWFSGFGLLFDSDGTPNRVPVRFLIGRMNSARSKSFSWIFPWMIQTYWLVVLHQFGTTPAVVGGIVLIEKKKIFDWKKKRWHHESAKAATAKFTISGPKIRPISPN